MKKIVLAVLVASMFAAGVAEAKGGFSSGGGRSSFSSSRSFSSSPSRSYSAPAPSRSYTPAAPRQSYGYQQPRQTQTAQAAPRPTPTAAGGFSSSGGARSGGSSFSSGRPSTSGAPTRSTTTTTSTRTTSSYSSRSYSGRNVGSYGGCMGCGMMYGGWGMGYGYMNGMLTGLIIADLMHPNGTTMYNGGGVYNNNALLYPNGQVVNQQGYQVGTYVNGQFTPMSNGPMVAQQVPADAVGSAPVAQPIIIQNTGPSVGDVFATVILAMVVVLLFVMLLAAL